MNLHSLVSLQGWRHFAMLVATLFLLAGCNGDESTPGSPHTVSYSAGTGGSLSGNLVQTIQHGKSGSPVTAVPDNGFSFRKWSDNSTANPRTDSGVITDMSLEATFERTRYTLTYQPGPGGAIAGQTAQTVMHGQDASTVIAVPDTGYRFVQWSDNSTDNPRIDRSVSGSLALTASFALKQYTLTYTAGAGGTLAGTTPQAVMHGSDASSVTAVPDTGHVFVKWSDNNSANPRRDMAVGTDITVQAIFAPKQYALNYTASAGGTLTGSTQQDIAHGSNATTVTAVPATGYAFKKWSDGRTDNPRTDSNVTAGITAQAIFALKQYTLAYTAGQGGSLTGNTSQTVAHGSSGTAVAATPATGYVFEKWSDGRAGNPRTDSNVAGSVSAQAVFARRQYTLTYTASAGGNLTGNTHQTISHGDDATAVTAVPDTGYRFESWSDGSTDNPRTDTRVLASATLKAMFVVKQHALNYSAGSGGSLGGNASQTISHGGASSAVTAIPAAGYVFVAWSDGATANPRIDSHVTASITVQATFALKQYTLAYAAGTGGSLTGNTSQTVSHGANGSAVTATPATGYQFIGWSDGNTSNPRSDNAVSRDISVQASFLPKRYTVTYLAGEHGTVTGNTSQSVIHGNASSAVTATPATGYLFDQWSDGSTANPRSDSSITGNISVQASFKAKQYTLAYAAGTGGSLGGNASQSVAHGGSGTAVTAIANTGYLFNQWSDGLQTSTRTDSNVTGNISVQASFKVKQYTLTYAAGTGGSISGNTSQTVAHGNSGSIVTATAAAGYVFDKWSDGVSTISRTDTNVTGSISVQASFKVKQYTLTYAAGTGGSLSGNTSQTVAHGNDGSTVTANATTGYVFDKWSDGVLTSSRTDSNITGNINVQASFKIKQYTLTYTPGPGGSITGQLAQTVQHGGTGTVITATASPGYVFDSWSDGSTANPRVDTNVTSTIAVQATFTYKQYTLTYTAGTGGAITGNINQAVISGGTGTAVTAVANTNYLFSQWSDGSTTNPRIDSNVTSSIAVQASFTLKQYTLIYAAGTGGSISGPSTQSVSHGNNGIGVTAIPDTGYVFTQWSDGVTTSTRTDMAIAANASYTASFTLKQYSVNYSAGIGGAVTGPATQTIAHGQNAATVTATPATGYEFLRWSDNGTANPRTDTSVIANISVEAVFALKQYALTYTAGAGGILTGQPTQSVTHGSDGSAITAVAAPGYTFYQWSDGRLDNPRTDLNVSSSVTVSASFKQETILAPGDIFQILLNSVGTTDSIRIRNSDASAAAEYLLVPSNLSPDSPLALAILGIDTGAPIAITGESGISPSITGTASAVSNTTSIRQTLLDVYSSHRGSSGGAPVASTIPSTANPAVGTLWNLNSNVADCSAGSATTGVVQAVGDHVIVVGDDYAPPGGSAPNPAGGLIVIDTISQLVPGQSYLNGYQQIAKLFDGYVYPRLTSVLGQPSDLDGNGKIVIFVTRKMNELSPVASSVTHTARYLPRDRLTQGECGNSNHGEIIYLMTPDPSGAVNSNVRTYSFVLGNATREIAHELGHLILDSRRIAAGSPFEAPWLAEALANHATEEVFYAATGTFPGPGATARTPLQPLQKIILSSLTTGPDASTRVAAFNTYINPMFGAYRPWLQAPSRVGILDSGSNTLAQHGGAWAFLRYAADRHANGSLVLEEAFWRNLVNSSSTGMANLASVINADPSEWLQDFLIASYISDNGNTALGTMTTSGKYTFASWNFRSVYGGLGGYSLLLSSLPTGASTPSALTMGKGGTASYIRFSVPAASAASIELTPNVVPDQKARATLIRLK